MSQTSTERYADYRKTDHWKAVVVEVKKRAGFRCQLCNSQHDLCAHHRTYDHRGRELEFLDDLVCLCRRCHEIFHGHEKPTPAPQTTAQLPLLSKRERREKWRLRSESLTNVRPHSEADIERDMPLGDGPITLTRDLLNRCRTNGAFTSATTDALGLAGPLVAGWGERLIGTEISRESYRRALTGRYIYAKLRFPK